jgi:hypothetical protein
LGVGGGALGFGGGALGQLGNLGGQFGLQGGDQSLILIQLIREVVGNPKEWQQLRGYLRPAAGPGIFNPAGQPAAQDREEEDDRLPPEQLNSLGYYPPSRALVVKGTSRIHTNLGGGLLSGAGVGGRAGAALDQKRDGALVFDPRNKQKSDKGNDQKLAAAKERREDKDFKLKDQPPSKDDLVAMTRLDPKKIWQDALGKGITDPGLIIAVADFLADCKKFDHLAEFLKANLRHGIVARAWVYDALAIALESSHAAPEDIERARVSLIDLQPQDVNGYLQASKAMADIKQFDRALAYCRQAALLQPNVPYPYEEALLYAELAKDTQAMEWAAGNLLRKDWPVENDDLHVKAGRKLQDLAKDLQGKNKAEAERMVQAAGEQRQRDLILSLHWQGEADLDLEVKEPIGTLCSFRQRQTPGGGILIGDTLADTSRETYVAAKAFTGEYEVTLRRIWGRPLGGKATLEIIQHQGTPRETRRRETIVFDRQHTLTVALDDGRRTSAEYVPPAAKQRRENTVEQASSGSALNQLRALADPEFTGSESSGLRGGLASLGVRVPSKTVPRPIERTQSDGVLYQTKVPQVVANSGDVTAQATVSPDRSEIRVKLSPVFQSVNKTPSMPAVTNPLIPGALDSAENR